MFTPKFQLMTSIIGTISLVLLALYGLMGLLSSSAWAQQTLPSLWGDSTVPLVMNYQGHVEDSEGNSLTGYYTMTFRIYDDVIATTALWEEEHQSVTVREGYFDVLLGNTTPISDTLFNQPDRFIGVTVHPHNEMVPRQRFASVPYAVHSYHATEADHATQADHAYALNAPDGDPADAVYVDDEGQVGIGTTSPATKLDVNGDLQYQAIKQRDATTSNYSIQAQRYYIEATKAQVRNTVPLDMALVNKLCKDEDGCTVTVGMKNWNNNDQPGNVASTSPYRFFISQTSNWWRLSNTDTGAVDGNGVTNHIIHAWDCYFTDGEYSNGTGSDSSVQLGLLNWYGTFNNPDMVCFLSIDD